LLRVQNSICSGGGGGGGEARRERMGRRILNDALRTMVNAERRGKATALLQPISGVMVSFLNIMKHRGGLPLHFGAPLLLPPA
jgi:hypothetical protein